MRALTARKAFLKSLPVMAGYLVLGTGFGVGFPEIRID